MSSSDSFWLAVWETIATIGFLIVILGVFIEGVEHFRKFPRKELARKERIQKLGWFLVVGGLATEFLGDHAAKRISDREIGRLTKEASESNERSKQLESTNLTLRANVAALEKQVLELELKVQHRRISPEQMDKAVSILRPLVKTNELVHVMAGTVEEAEVRKYGEDFINLFKSSGYSVEWSGSGFTFGGGAFSVEGVTIMVCTNPVPSTAAAMQRAMKEARIDVRWSGINYTRFGEIRKPIPFIVFIGKRPL